MEKVKIDLDINGETIPCIAGILVSRDGTFEIAELESAAGAEVEGTDLKGLLTLKDIYDSIEFQIVEKKGWNMQWRQELKRLRNTKKAPE